MFRSVQYAHFVFAAILLAMCPLTRPASADLAIYIATGEATSYHASKSFNPSTGGWDVTLKVLYNPANVTLYELRASTGVVIDNLIIDVPCWEDSEGHCIPAGSPVFVRVFSDPPHGVRTVHNIIQTGDAETLLTHVIVQEDIGFVQAQAIGILEAGRDIVGPVISTTPDNFIRGVSLATAERDILGDILAPNGRVGLLSAGRDIGTPNNPVQIRARHNSMSIFADRAIYADISTRENGDQGHLAALFTPSFTGTVSTRTMGDSAFSADPPEISISEQFNGAILLGRSHDDPQHLIRLPREGFNGQLIFNTDNLSDATWTAPVYLGNDDDPDQIVLNGPGYDLANDLLGGAIGLVPFRLHGPSCYPQPGSDVLLAPHDGPLAVRIEHDGPVTWTGGPPIAIERRPIEGGSYQPVSLSQFYITHSPNNPRAIIIDPINPFGGFVPGYEYRILQTSHLRSDVPDAPQTVWNTPFTFTVNVEPYAPCTGDLNDDNVVNLEDLIILINSWGPAPDSHPADLTGDGFVGLPDLLLLINNWGPCESTVLAPAGDEPSGTISPTSREPQPRRDSKDATRNSSR